MVGSMMEKSKMVLRMPACAVLLGLLVCVSPTQAQYDGPVNAFAYGKGPGKSGLDFLGPGTIPGLPIYSGSASTPPRIGGELTIAPSTSYTVTTNDCSKVFANNHPTDPQTYSLPQTVSALKNCAIGFVNTTGALVTVNAYSGDSIFTGGPGQAAVQGVTFPLTTVKLVNLASAIYLKNNGGVGLPGWNEVSATVDVRGSANGFYRPPQNNLLFDGTTNFAHGYPDGSPAPYNGGYTARISAADGGGYQLINPVTGVWDFYQVNAVHINLACVTIDGVDCQSADTNTYYYVYLYATGAPPNAIGAQLSTTTYTGATGTLFQTKIGYPALRWAGNLMYIAADFLTQNGTLSPGTNTAITGLTDTTYLSKGQEIRGTGITRTNPPCRIDTIDSPTQVTPMTCTVTGSGAASLQFPSLVVDPIGYFGPGVQTTVAGTPTQTTNAFGVQACGGQDNSGTGVACDNPTALSPAKSATAVLLDARVATVSVVSNGTKMQKASAKGTVTNSIAGRRVCIQLRVKNIQTGSYQTPSRPTCVRANASNAEMDISADLSQPFAAAGYRYEIWRWEPDGTGDQATYNMQLTVFQNSP